MAENSKIEWTTHTFNPWLGCTKISLACYHCYAEGWAKRTGGAALWQGERRRTTVIYWRMPLKWNKAAECATERPRVFCASLADVFDNQVPAEWRSDLWALIRATPNLDWLLLTKRPQNIRKMLPADWGDGYPNVWLGTTVENQEEAQRRIPALLEVNARVHFLSCEPLLGAVNLRSIDIDGDYEMDSLKAISWLDLWNSEYSPEATNVPLDEAIEAFQEIGPYPPTDIKGNAIDWVICGGESGPGARPMMIQWARGLRDQCKSAGVPFFLKQWGEFAPDDPAASRTSMQRVGKKAAGRLLDGIEHNGMPGAHHD